MFQTPEIRKFLGLFAQANSFSLPDGAMERARNIAIGKDNIISKIRGFYQYFSPGAGTLNALFLYKSKLLAAFTDGISYFTDTGSSPNETGLATALTGATVGITTLKSRSVGQNGNFYFTTDNGLLKIDDYNAKIFKAGSPPALDLRGSFAAANGPFNGNSEVAYRVLFGRTDANDNLILGAPSDILLLTNSAVATVTWARAANVVTVTSTNHNLSTGMSVIVTVSSTGGGGTSVPLSTFVVTVTSSSTFTFANVAGNDSGTLTYTVTRAPVLETSVPTDITTTADQYFIQIYRTTQSNDVTASPSPDFKLVEQRTLTSSEISTGVVFYEDQTDDFLLVGASELYTNPNSQEGELQANARPPLALDVVLFQNYVFYANCRTREVLDLDVVDTSVIANNDYIEIKVDTTTRRYIAKSGVGNQTVKSESITNSGGKLRVDYTAHGFSNGYKIYINEITGGTLTPGFYFVVSAAANNFQISLTSGGTAVNYNGETELYFEGVTDGTNPIFGFDATSISVATQIANTAKDIVRAVNRDGASLVYANYVSGIEDAPGKMVFSAKDFTGIIYLRASSTATGQAFSPALPDTFSTVFSRNSARINSVYFSKVEEPEAVPLLNSLKVGAKNKAILRILALRDSIIVLKEDGVFKITGDSPANFSSIPLDTTIIVAAADSAALLNNQVYFLGNQGICIASDSAVQIVSRRIEDLIEPIIGATNIVSQTSALGYESDRTYRCSTIGENQTTRTITYAHNTINDTWTDSDILFIAGAIGPSNILYLISTDNKIMKERKTGTRLDFTGQNFSTVVVSVSADLMSAVITTAATPEVGDILVLNGVICRIRTVAAAGGNWTVTFPKVVNFAASATPILYKRIVSEVDMAPFHAGEVGRMKQYSEMQIHSRTDNLTRLRISFITEYFGGSEETIWTESESIGASGGWGNEPWGFFPWGEDDGIDILSETSPAPIVRIWVPSFAQRATYVKTVMVHEEAGESMDIQAQTWAIRPYQQRVSK